jgi:hypothetical protein
VVVSFLIRSDVHPSLRMCTVCFLKLHSMIALITLNSTIGTSDNILQKYVKHIRKYALYSDGISQVSRLDHWFSAYLWTTPCGLATP